MSAQRAFPVLMSVLDAEHDAAILEDERRTWLAGAHVRYVERVDEVNRRQAARAVRVDVGIRAQMMCYAREAFGGQLVDPNDFSGWGEALQYVEQKMTKQLGRPLHRDEVCARNLAVQDEFCRLSTAGILEQQEQKKARQVMSDRVPLGSIADQLREAGRP